MENKKVILNLEDFSVKKFKENCIKINKKIKEYQNNQKLKNNNKTCNINGKNNG